MHQVLALVRNLKIYYIIVKAESGDHSPSSSYAAID